MWILYKIVSEDNINSLYGYVWFLLEWFIFVYLFFLIEVEIMCGLWGFILIVLFIDVYGD